MKDVLLPGSQRATSRFGYGTSGLHGGWSKRSSLALLEAAFDSGIRHFDTAPMYGLGAAEEVVGEFIARHRAQVTITTKFGLSSPRANILFRAARVVLRPIVSHLPRAKSQLVRAASALSRADVVPASARYSVPAMQASLEQSLRKLRCDGIDIFLLHEADAFDVTDDLRTALDNLVRKGWIGAWGLGSARSKIDRAVGAAQIQVPVVQFEWSVISNRLPVYPHSFTITHGVLKDCISWLKVRLASPRCRQVWSDKLNCDLADPAARAKLLLGSAAVANSEGIVLFTSKVPMHIRNVASVSEADEQNGKKFLLMLETVVGGKPLEGFEEP